MKITCSSKLAWLAVAGLLLFVTFDIAPVQGRQATSARPTAGQIRAVALLRLLNTAEARYDSQYRNYATRSQLLKSGIPQKIAAGPGMTPFGAHGTSGTPDLGSSDPAPGYLFTLYVSPDRSHYLASLRDNSKDRCGPSFYTDQSGLILQAKPLGCQ